jgi:hypothetical protein
MAHYFNVEEWLSYLILRVPFGIVDNLTLFSFTVTTSLTTTSSLKQNKYSTDQQTEM